MKILKSRTKEVISEIDSFLDTEKEKGVRLQRLLPILRPTMQKALKDSEIAMTPKPQWKERFYMWIKTWGFMSGSDPAYPV
jgi:hypothetical protein